MCGISVLFHKEKISTDLYVDFLKSLQLINHRGPDDEGIVLINTNTGEHTIARSAVNDIIQSANSWTNSYNLALGHKRLSIIDLSANGHQPMQGNDGSWIVFNGEIYNYIEVREELKKIGCHFKTKTDTEVILEAYRCWGKECLTKFNGMWAFCIWDAVKKQVFMSNDRFGVKPAYYVENESGFNIVSETKQLRAFSNFRPLIDLDHVNDFLDFGYVDVDESTIYKNVSRFRKSCYAFVDPLSYVKNDLKKNQLVYYKITQNKVNISEKEAIEQFRYLLYDAVRIRMRADVDFAFALSGGIDSSAILYTARNIINQENLSNVIHGVSAVFPGYDIADESKFIKIVGDDLPCDITYTNPMDEFNFDEFEKHVYHQDDLHVGTAFFAQWSIYKKVKESGIKILFNGQGADEVFAGYHHHFYRYCRQLLMKGKLLEYFSAVNQYAYLKEIPKQQIHNIVINEVKLKAKIVSGISKFDNKLFKHWSKVDSLDEVLVRDLDTFQIPTFLRVDDRNSMAFSIESRHPFMDYRLVEYGYSLPHKLLINNGWQKHIIRKSMTEMPEAIRFRKDKKGFTTPQDVWLAKYKDKFEEYLSYNNNFFGKREVSKVPYKNYVIGAWLKVNEL
jgi:asparagine synthase (glutamine-hydrolysing)